MSNVQELFNQAVSALNSRNYKEAEKLFRAVLEKDAKHVPALNLLAALLMSMERFGEAEKFIASAVNLNQGSDVSFYNYGLVLKQLNRPQEALEQFNRALQINGNVPETWNNRGTILNDLKLYQEAIADFERALLLQPTYSEALANKGKSLKALRLYDEALAAYDKALVLKPDLAGAWLGRGDVLYDLERNDEALTACDKALALKPDLVEAWLCRGKLCQVLKRRDEALIACDKALVLKPDLIEAWLGRGSLCHDLNRRDEALAAYDKAIALKPDLAEAWLGRGNILIELKDYDEAIAACNKALAIKPDMAACWLCRGNIFHELERSDDALAAYDKALVKSDLAEAWLGRGNVLYDLKRRDEALAAYDKALVKSDLAEAWLGRGNVLYDRKDYEAALVAYDKAFFLKPDLAQAWLGRGNVLYDLKQYEAALAGYDKALALKIDLAQAWLGRGNVFADLKRYDQAFAAYDKAFALKPNLTPVEGMRLYTKMMLCDWSNFEAERDHLINKIKDGNENADPFAFLSVSDSPADQLHYAQLWVSRRWPTTKIPLWDGDFYNHDRIRVAYLSGDFGDHPVAQGLSEILEYHDRTHFELIGLSSGPDDGSALRKRISNSFDQFHDVRSQSDSGAARFIRGLEVDVLVILAPHTANSRLGILAHRPAPIQISGMSAWTSGADFIDYILADARVLPFEERPYFTEKIVHLPDSFFAVESQQQVNVDFSTREHEGLPSHSFVFCCFNNSFKLTPRTFDIWMSLLRRIDGSVLWLKQSNSTMKENLIREAVTRNIDPTRLVFASSLPSLSAHLARHRFADLFLDTLPYCAHTTAKDALWTGLPVLTQAGKTFVGRVSASLLDAIGLPELITETEEEYESKAVELASEPQKLQAIRARLQLNRLTEPLFNTRLFTRHLESAYQKIYERHQKGLPPDDLVCSA